MTNQEKRAKLERKQSKKHRKDRMMTGLGYGACVGFVALAVCAAADKILWGAVALLGCMAIGILVPVFLNQKD